MSDLEKVYERYVPLDDEGNPVDLDKQIAKFRAQRAAEQQLRIAGPLRREAEREAKRQAKLAKAAERERVKVEKARLKTEAKAAKAKPDPRQIDLEDLIDTINKDSA